MSGVVEDLLDLARQRKPATTIVDVRESWEAMLERLQRAESWETEVAVDGHGRIRGDRAKVERVITNLVRNAVEAAGPNGKVTISVREREGFVELVVRDSGMGMDASSRARLFEPFFTTKPTGTGLGLAVSQAIAKSHRGVISAVNGEDGGAVFTLRLPAVEADDGP